MLEQFITLFFNKSPLSEQESGDLLIAFAKIILIAMLVPIFIAIVYRKEWNKPLFVAFLFCLLTFMVNFLEQIFLWLAGNYTEMVIPFLDFFNIKNTFFFTVFYYGKDYLILGWFYSLIITTKNNLNKTTLWVSYTLTFIMLINYLFFNGYDDPGVLNPTLNAVYVVVLPLLYLWFSQKESLRISLYKSPYFWISLGVFIPNLLGLFIYIIQPFAQSTDYILFIRLKVIKNIFDLLGFGLISYGFTKSRYARFIEDND